MAKVWIHWKSAPRSSYKMDLTKSRLGSEIFPRCTSQTLLLGCVQSFWLKLSMSRFESKLKTFQKQKTNAQSQEKNTRSNSGRMARVMVWAARRLCLACACGMGRESVKTLHPNRYHKMESWRRKVVGGKAFDIIWSKCIDSSLILSDT